MVITSAGFHLAGNVLVSIEQLIMSVKGPSMTGKQSFSMRALTFSGPGDLFSGRDDTTRRTSSYVTVLKLNTLLFFFYKNIFYKNIEAEICEILRIL